MSEKFTPGPWEIVRVHLVPIGIGTRRQSSGAGVHCFRMLGNTLERGDEEQDLDEIEANARLIACSPDFYAAAKTLCDRHDERARAANFERCGCDDCTPFRAALKKAVGE